MSDVKNTVGSGWVEIHSHFLPGIDDGCKHSDESIQVLQTMYKQNVTAAVATPHYYPQESVAQFLKRREQSYNHLMEVIDKKGDLDGQIPQIYLAAEVAYREGISRDPMLEELCYDSGKTRYLLLEMPFHRWSGNVLHEVEIIRHSCGITPVIAHLERYDHYQTKDILDHLFGMDVMIQMNSEFMLNRWTSHKALKRIKTGMVQVIGSDCHNMTSRQPTLGDAIALLNKKGMAEEAEQLRQNAACILAGIRK